MYNELQKNRFIKELDDVTANRAKLIFSKTEQAECEAGYDICNFSTEEYCPLLMKLFNINKFSYLNSLMQTLIRYRAFCIKSDFIDEKIFYSNINNITTALHGPDYEELYQAFSRQYNEDTNVSLYSPENLYELLNNVCVLSSERSIISEASNILNKKNSVMSNQEMIILLIMLIYFGVHEDEICDMRLNDVVLSEIEDNSYEILSIKRYTKIHIIGSTFELLGRRLQSKHVSYFMRYEKIEKLSDEYVFGYEQDDNMELRKKRIHAYLNTYRNWKRVYKDRYNIDFPTLSNIKMAGCIYKICRFIHFEQMSIDNDRVIIDYYNRLAEKPLKRKDSIDDMLMRVRKTYEYLY